MLKLFKKAVISVVSAAAAMTSAAAVSSFADWQQLGFMGDLNNDKVISVADVVIMTKHLLGERFLTSENAYDTKGKFIGINGGDGFLSDGILETADINRDGRVDLYDLILLRKHLVANAGFTVWEWIEPAVTTAPSTSSAVTQTTSTTAVTAVTAPKNYISPPIYDLYGSMPSQNEAEMAVFYVDFPDCKYSYDPTVKEIEEIVFGDEDVSDSNYPFESMNAFFSRSSKGAMKLDGKAYRYTAKNNKSSYENDVWHVALVNEIIAEFDASVDFSQFDGDKDGIIDSILISVPEAAGDDNWWASAGTFGGETSKRADGMDIGHVIVGNAEIKSASDYSNFNSSYLHELGHCMGLPDYYLYGVDDFQGMHGSAGFEMMDDAICDFGAASKLMLGWYAPEQIQVYDKNAGTADYILTDAQTDGGNCVIIPCGELDGKYRSEFFIIEYAAKNFNNSSLEKEWWRATGNGVRVYHVEATESGDPWYNTFKYSSGNDENTDSNNGRRFIRLVGEGTDDTDNFFKTSDIIDNSVSGFNWYDADGKLTTDPGVTIKIGEKTGDAYVITVSVK